MPRKSVLHKPKHNRTSFKKGEPVEKRPVGRPPGVGNRIPTVLKECIIRAAEIVGEDGRGKGGLTGYLVKLARVDRKTFAGLMRPLIPLTINGSVDHNHQFKTREEVEAALRERGLPVVRIYPDAEPPPRTLPPPLKVVSK